MLERIQKQKLNPTSPLASFKYSPGGLLHTEFFTQALQLTLAHKFPQLQSTNTLNILQETSNLNLINPQNLQLISQNYSFLKQIEFYLRRYFGEPSDSLYSPLSNNPKTTHWLGFHSPHTFQQHYSNSLQKANQALSNSFQDLLNSIDSSP